MTDIREAAAKAAREWEDEIDATENRPGTGEACFIDGYLLGHAAGVADGARAEAEKLAALLADLDAAMKMSGNRWDEWGTRASAVGEMLDAAIWKARPAPGTTLAEAEGQKEEG